MGPWGDEGPGEMGALGVCGVPWRDGGGRWWPGVCGVPWGDGVGDGGLGVVGFPGGMGALGEIGDPDGGWGPWGEMGALGDCGAPWGDGSGRWRAEGDEGPGTPGPVHDHPVSCRPCMWGACCPGQGPLFPSGVGGCALFRQHPTDRGPGAPRVTAVAAAALLWGHPCCSLSSRKHG